MSNDGHNSDHSRTEPLLVTPSARELRYILRFLAVGVLNTLVGLGTIYGCKLFLSLEDIPANILGYAVGLVNSFFWNRRWTFAHTNYLARTMFRFIAVFLVAYGANLATALGLIRQLGVDAYLAHAIATAPFTVLFYLGSRYFTFVPQPVVGNVAGRDPPRDG
jgi:putative flippase GtrA